MPRIAIIAISTCIGLMRRGSRVNSGSMKNGLSACTTKSIQEPGDVDPRQVADVVDDLVDLRDHDAVAEGGGLDQRRRVFGARAGVEVACAVGLEAGDEHDVRRQVDVQAPIELDVGVDRADLEHAVLQELRDAQALRAGVGEVELAGDAALEQVELLGTADARA